MRIEVIHPVEDTQQCRLSAARGTDEGGHLLLVERHRDRLERPVVAVEELEAPDRHLLGQIVALHRLVGDGDGGGGNGSDGHDWFLAASARAPIESASTAKVIIKAPVQASCCQSL